MLLMQTNTSHKNYISPLIQRIQQSSRYTSSLPVSVSNRFSKQVRIRYRPITESSRYNVPDTFYIHCQITKLCVFSLLPLLDRRANRLEKFLHQSVNLTWPISIYRDNILSLLQNVVLLSSGSRFSKENRFKSR